MFKIRCAQLYFKQDCCEDNNLQQTQLRIPSRGTACTTFLNHSQIFILFWPGYSICTLQTSSKVAGVPHIQLICEFLPLRSPQNCNSVLASIQGNNIQGNRFKGKLLSGHFHHRTWKIFPCNSLMPKVLLLSVLTSSWQFTILLFQSC